MIVGLIAALARDRVIGVKNTIPFNLSADLAWFRCRTLNKPVIMGRKTFESIGSVLPERKNIVLSDQPDNNSSVTWASFPEQALLEAGKVDAVMVIGGGKVYETFLNWATRLYLTYIDASLEGDTWFPDYEIHGSWFSTFISYHKKDSKNIYNYCFEILERDL
ncbi:dihydrofolate reductase [secondary endosymbiont of Heteropsylla cubana]|uniref:Dihydrofolate reductase n=1 Tax=secondary endosymbiont of Heteropsylla cubana TaxID=134287 RepID=J3TGI3_9ENTR|nr:type 3 dihydrofolate reductase [secondary endosymbiont of Heteropsylla cubana]AFP85552.1 dihydrofolate reductase [secondary endosymbiont of Heteropsylla cubana]